ncbi:protein Z-dependent protease inhibitor isoform X2 [Alosa sapidissima]|uniref:protein Z-dependent protease inhibitor isoform X2 n=1 Tax=Alosa sapidissima TaxID=34773 RepID=UPI001C093F5F|nr:protein Z-dependent protease inhibitor isoform X2 [Alosa sapidissima]
MMTTVLFLVVWTVLLTPCLLVQEEPSPNITHLTFKNMDFAMNLYRKISSYHDNNIFFSPLCLSTVFTSLSLGARGSTRDQILKGLNLDLLEHQGTSSLIPELFQHLQRNITQDNALMFHQSTALFVGQDFEIEMAFSEQIKKFFGADINNVDFADPKVSMATINEYVRKQTGNKVKEMVSSIEPFTKLMLINTIFFKAMLIVLPDTDTDYTEVDEEITAARFIHWTQNLKKTKLEIHLPKFKMEQSYTVQKILPELGITNIFQDTANLTGLSKSPGLKVSEVLHKAVIEVDEIGTTAAAATTVGITAFSLPHTFIINRPFFFFIYHESTNSLLFMGRVIDPSKC